MRRLSAVCLQKVPRVASRRSCGNGRSLSSGGRVSSRNRFALPHQQHAQPLKARAHPTRHSEKLLAIIEFKNRGDSHEDATDKLVAVKRDVTGGGIQLARP